jgi:hypothetical protein
MALQQPKPLPQQPHVPLVTVDGGIAAVPTPWMEWLQSIDRVARSMATGNVGGLVNAANDAAAATAGVPIGGLYRSGNAVQIRVI